MKRFPLFLLFTLLTLSTVPAQADIDPTHVIWTQA